MVIVACWHKVDEALLGRWLRPLPMEWVSQVKVPERSPYEAKNRETCTRRS
jgi:hypothetical protein